MSDQNTEQEIQAKGLTAPRITPLDVANNMADIEYVTFTSRSGQVLRWCVVTANNGYAIVGKPSCAVSSENDNEELGMKVAYDNTVNEMWPLMGYELKSKLTD